MTTGPGGSYPGANAVGGSWDAVLPTDPLVSTQAVTVPAGTVLNSIVIRGWAHTWQGDSHVVLTSPGGTNYNVLVLANSTTPNGGGCGDDLSGDYTIVDFNQGGPCPPALTPIGCSGSGSLPAGTYPQDYGSWTSGNAGLQNTALESIPLASGNWTLTIYDWYPPFDAGSIASWEMCFGAPTPPPPPPPVTSVCVGSGVAGSYPAPGAVDGTWPTTLPTGEFISPNNITVPSGATKIVAVKLNDWTHSWYDDSHVVLQSPAGVLYNLLQANDGAPGGTCGDNLMTGEYRIVDAVVGTDPCGVGAPSFPACNPSFTINPGTYLQTWGAWPAGSASIQNVALESIPIASGTWNLIFYDWLVGADDGSITGWEMCFDVVPGPVTYCTPGTTTNGCTAQASASANPSVSGATSCVITINGVEGQKNGIVFYGLSAQAIPWGTGSTSTLCVKSPAQRMSALASGGTINQCNGTLTQNWDTWQAANPTAQGNPWVVGEKAYVQGWFRDPPAPKTTSLSNAVELTYEP